MAGSAWHGGDMSQIRAFHPDDADAVRALGSRLRVGVAPWRDAQAVADAITGWVTEALAGADDPGRTMLIADHEGRVVGFVTGGTRGHWSGERDAYIGELAVAQDAEGTGIGTQLLTAIEDWAVAQGHGRITLETGAANGRARKFYERRGYRTEEVVLTRALR